MSDDHSTVTSECDELLGGKLFLPGLKAAVYKRFITLAVQYRNEIRCLIDNEM